MSSRNLRLSSSQAGFTITELVISMLIMAVIGTTFLVFFKSSFFNYLNLQTDASALTQLSRQTNRVAQVLRGTTDITSVTANEFNGYSYFYPSDTYVSVIRYYIVTSGTTKVLRADVTPMSSNPPIGTPLTAQKRTYTVIDNFYQPTGINLFTYTDSSGNTLTLPISDLQTIKGIKVSLAAKGSSNSNHAVSVDVSLRNRKTNL